MRDIPNFKPGLQAIVLTVAVIDQFTDANREVTCVTYVFEVGNEHHLYLCCYDVPPQPSSWLEDNLQQGIHHIGFQVLNTDATAARLKATTIPITLDPVDTPSGAHHLFPSP